MGITIHYRGKIDNIADLETLEDRVIDLTLAFGGQVQVWRSAADHDPQRMVRGLLVDLDPGQETFSLLFSPEGFLVPLLDIEEAEKHPFTEPPWCFVKTQFGSVEGHAALVETLSELKPQFLSSLEVHDESGYWDHRDPQRLAAAINQNAKAIDAMAAGLKAHPLTREAAEDAQIVAARVERVAQIVHQAMRKTDDQFRSPIEAPNEFSADGPESEAYWDQLYRDSAARTLRLEAKIEAQMLSGRTAEEALKSAMSKVAEDHDDESSDDDLVDPDAETIPLSEMEWRPTDLDAEDFSGESCSSSFNAEDVAIPVERRRDPLLERATQLFLKVSKHIRILPEPRSVNLLSHAGELCGGLAQVLPLAPPFEMDAGDRGRAAVQLKRSLRGAAFLRGALMNQRVNDVADRRVLSQFIDEVEELQGEIVDLLRQVRQTQ